MHEAPEDCPLSALQERALQRRYQKLKGQLAGLGWISQGSVMHKPPGAWRWTRKVRAKTVGVALSAEQARHYRQALQEHRKLEAILRQMREISQKILLASAPGVRQRPRRKSS